MDAARKKIAATYADIEALPDHQTGEIIAGELFTAPRPARRHLEVQADITADLRMMFGRGQGGPGGWIILPEPELHLAQHVLVPDLAGWRRSALSNVPLDKAFLDVAPDWVCEIASPSTRFHDRVRKLPLYRELGVGYAWLVDPDHHTVTAYRRAEAGWLLVGNFDGRVVAEIPPFVGVELDVGAWWPDDPSFPDDGKEPPREGPLCEEPVSEEPPE